LLDLDAGRAMDSGSTEIVVDCGFSRIYSDGRVERFAGMETVPAGLDADTGVFFSKTCLARASLREIRVGTNTFVR
jgi:hypothetical protein